MHIYDCKTSLQATEDRPYYFARKFEPIINQQIIEQVETWMYGSKNGKDSCSSCDILNEFLSFIKMLLLIKLRKSVLKIIIVTVLFKKQENNFES